MARARQAGGLLLPLLLLLRCAPRGRALENGVGLLPIMGYGTWNDLGCDRVSGDAIKRIADAIVARGLDRLGYSYLNVDDCWSRGREWFSHRLVPDRDAFPDGMQSVIDYVHYRGLKFGLYTDRGLWTCAARPGSLHYEVLDAQTFASWGVDYLKVDSCNAPGAPRAALSQYVKMRDALNATGRPIFFALCGWSPWYAEVGRAVANSWRVAKDMNGICELWNTAQINAELAAYAGPGAWNDPDALIGSTEGTRVRLTQQQSRTQFGLWAIMAAPLILGTDLSAISDYDLETYTNAEVIAVDQDPLGHQGSVIWENCPPRSIRQLVNEADESKYSLPPACQQVWARPLQGGDWAVLFLNWDALPAQMTLRPEELFKMGLVGEIRLRDLWRKQDLGVHSTGPSASVEANGGSEMFRLGIAGSGVRFV